MAIYGDLSSISLQDVALVIKNRSGVLDINLKSRSYRLYCNQDQLCGMLANGTPLYQPEVVMQQLSDLLHQPGGSFQFEEHPPSQEWEKAGLSLPFCQTLSMIKSKVSVSPDLPRPASNGLPHPDIRYVLLRSRKILIPENLASFLEQAQPLLEKTFSARELAEQTSLDLDLVRNYLSELRKINKVLPVRAYQEPAYNAPETDNSKIPDNPTSKAIGGSVIKRLLSLLKGTS